MSKHQIPVGPTALSLSGGGSKGSYMAGMLVYLWEVLNIRDYRIIYGTSTGALLSAMYGAAVCTGDPKYASEATKIYRKVETGDILDARLFTDEILGLAAALIGKEVSIYKTEPLQQLIEQFIPNAAWRRMIQAGNRKRNPIEVGFAVVNMQTGEGEIFTTKTHPDRDTLKAALLASASMPIFTPLVKIGKYQYSDGGLTDYNPIEFVLKSERISDVNSVISLNLDWLKTKPTKPFSKVGNVLLQTIGILSHQVYQKDIQTARFANILLKIKSSCPDSWDSLLNSMTEEEKIIVNNYVRSSKPLEIINVEPLRELDMESLVFEQPKMAKYVSYGFKDAAKLLTVASVDLMI